MANLGEILWQPGEQRRRDSRMHHFMETMAGRYGFQPDWPSLHRWSVQHTDQFWPEMLAIAEIQPFVPADTLRSGTDMLDTQWFCGMQLNYAAHLLRRRDDGLAILAADERGRRRRLTFRELHAEVAACAAALRRAGIRRGDRVAGFLPNIPEAVIAMLATAALGAVWSSCSPDFGVSGVLDRFGQIEPKILLTADGYTYNGKKFDSLQRVRGIADRISSIGQVVVIDFVQDRPALTAPREVPWSEFVGGQPFAEELQFEAVPFDHPLFIMYSSGTTGVPKCIMHGHGGTLLQHMKELMLHCDLRADETIFYFTTCGWMMWNWVVSSLGAGATLVLYEGSPSHPDLGCLWQLASEVGIQVFGTSPKFLTSCENAGQHPAKQYDLSALRCVLSTGSPLSVENFAWVYSRIKSDVQLSSICGGTDIISCFMLGNPILPVRAGEIQCLGLGMDVRAFDDDANAVVGVKGELVCCSPFPSQPIGFWNDPDRRKYRGAYFERYPGVWHHGDFIELTPAGGVVVYGRSDSTLNPGGVRIGTAEIYRVVEALNEVQDSLVVGRQAGDDVEVCLFVVLQPGVSLDDDLRDRIRRHIAENTTRRHVPRHVYQVNGVPYTISGKKVEVAVAQLLRGQPVKNRDALANPAVLDEYAAITSAG